MKVTNRLMEKLVQRALEQKLNQYLEQCAVSKGLNIQSLIVEGLEGRMMLGEELGEDDIEAVQNFVLRKLDLLSDDKVTIHVLEEGLVCDDCFTDKERAEQDRANILTVETHDAVGTDAEFNPHKKDICVRCKKPIPVRQL